MRQRRGEEEERGRQIEPMLGDGRVQREDAADRQIAEHRQEEQKEDGRVAFSLPNQPIDERGDEDDVRPGFATRARPPRSDWHR